MKIVLGIDAIRYPLTGIGRYAYELGKGLSNSNDIDSCLFMANGAITQQLPDRPNIANAVIQAKTGLRRMVASVPFAASVYHRLNTFKQNRGMQLLGKSNFIFHSPNYYLPQYSGCCVSTFHDLSVFVWPECHPKIRVEYMQRELPLAVRRAEVLVTDSEFTRQEVAAFFNLSLDKIVVAPLAASSDFCVRNSSEVNAVLAQYGLSYGAYSLFVGTLDPRKNINLLLDVYERLPNNLRKRFPLVVVGYEGWKSELTLERLKKGEHQGWARYLGFVDEYVLPFLYSGAKVFLFPSKYEGFGLPILEAMAAGVPVICSDATSLPEVAGEDGAKLIAVDNVDLFYDAVWQALDDKTWCLEAGKRGLERSKSFNWDKTIKATIGAYRLAIE